MDGYLDEVVGVWAKTVNWTGFVNNFKRRKDLQWGRFWWASMPASRYKHEFRPLSTCLKERTAQQDPANRSMLDLSIFHECCLFWTVAWWTLSPAQIPLSVGYSYIICADRVQNIPLRQQDQKMKWDKEEGEMSREMRWRGPRLIPLVPVKFSWLEVLQMMSTREEGNKIHGGADGWRKNDSGNRKDSKEKPRTKRKGTDL